MISLLCISYNTLCVASSKQEKKRRTKKKTTPKTQGMNITIADIKID
jgi:hypothetical protein